jgi:putative hemolysin
MEPFAELPDPAPRVAPACRRRPGGYPVLRDGHLELRLAEGQADKADAQRLRFDVFNRELRLGLASSLRSGMDQDAHDGHCDHLLAIDTARDCLVGTYRLLPFDRVPSFGLYSESEFDLVNVKRSGLRLLELGRSCVAQEYRDGKVIRLLFQGIAEYLRRCGANALMGCASIHGVDAEALASVQEFLSDRFLTGPELRVTPLRGFEVPPVPVVRRLGETAAFRMLPPLFKGYLRMGARICGPPAYDRQFGTTDFFVLARTCEIDQRYTAGSSDNACSEFSA